MSIILVSCAVVLSNRCLFGVSVRDDRSSRGEPLARVQACIDPARMARPVWLTSTCEIAIGDPVATTRPPPSPPSGPRSITQSAEAITSSWCSITTTVWPRSARRWRIASSRSMSAKCRPVVGSSRI